MIQQNFTFCFNLTARFFIKHYFSSNAVPHGNFFRQKGITLMEFNFLKFEHKIFLIKQKKNKIG